jgi:hypothetical protein
LLSSFLKHFHAIILSMQNTAAKDNTLGFLSQRQGAGVPAARFSFPNPATAAENASSLACHPMIDISILS